MPPNNKPERVAPNPHVKQLTTEELQKFMSFHGVSDKELATMIGKSARTIESWLNGNRNICLTTSKLIRLLDRYPTMMREV